MKIKQLVIMMLCAIAVLSSCTSSKKLIYLQEKKKEQVINQDIKNSYDPRIQNDDLLYISISSKDAELIEPFTNSTLIGNTSTSSTEANGFLVNNDGFVSLPSLGHIYVRGLTCGEIASKIENQLIDDDYIKDPIVSVRLGNFKVSILGEVDNPGEVNIKGNRVTILEAISQGGDLKPTAKRKNVKIVREINGKRSIHTIDLTKANIIESPYYYLCQNDIIYVEPNKSIGTKSSTWSSILGIGGTLLSLAMSIATLVVVAK